MVFCAASRLGVRERQLPPSLGTVSNPSMASRSKRAKAAASLPHSKPGRSAHRFERPQLRDKLLKESANVKTRIIFYSAFAGYLIGFFARTTFNPILEYLTPEQGCLLGPGPYWNAVLMVAPQNAVLYGAIGGFIAIAIGLITHRKVAITKDSSNRKSIWANVVLFSLMGILLLPFVILMIALAGE